MGARDQTGLFVTHRVVLGWLIALVACKPTTAERHTASRRGTGFDTSLNAFDTSLNACTTSPRSQRYVVLSADTNDMAYAAFLPLTTYVWAQKHGVKPIVVLVAQTPVSAQADYVATWVVRAGEPAGVTVAHSDTHWSLGWTLPDLGFQLQAAPGLFGLWTNLSTANAVA